MMNYIFSFLTVVSIIYSFFVSSPADVSSAIIESGSAAVSLCIKLLGMMCMWNGIMEVADKSGLCGAISHALNPLLRIIMPKERQNAEIKKAVSMNVTANLLGLGNSATPLGIEAMRRMKDFYKVKDSPTPEMIAFVVLNTASLRIIPTTSMMMRQSAGAAQPADIIFCVWISSACSLAVALTACKICERIFYR